MWVIVFNAVDEFGIKEVNEAIRLSTMQSVPGNPAIEGVKHKLLDEALHGALRIAGLVCYFAFPVSTLMYKLISIRPVSLHRMAT